MSTFGQRLIGAARLDRAIYEEVEADTNANGQALAVVLLSSIAGGAGSMRLGTPTPGDAIVGTVAALVGWVAWATLTSLIGTRVLPEPDTHSNVGELLRTLGFAASPGLLLFVAVIPVGGSLLSLVIHVWMLMTMIVAVRQALDYRSTARAVAVCLVGWAVSLVIAFVIAAAFARAVQ